MPVIKIYAVSVGLQTNKKLFTPDQSAVPLHALVTRKLLDQEMQYGAMRTLKREWGHTTRPAMVVPYLV